MRVLARWEHDCAGYCAGPHVSITISCRGRNADAKIGASASPRKFELLRKLLELRYGLNPSILKFSHQIICEGSRQRCLALGYNKDEQSHPGPPPLSLH